MKLPRPFNRTTVDPELLAGAVPAPTAAEIIADPASMAARSEVPYYALRDPHLEGVAGNTKRPLVGSKDEFAQASIIPTTEANALYDLRLKMLAAEGIIQTYATDEKVQEKATIAASVRERVQFMGDSELTRATGATATEWLRTLDTSAAGELFVGVENGKSSILIYERVIEAVRKRNPDAANVIHPIALDNPYDYPEPANVERVKRAGLRLLDDWTISGTRMKQQIHSLQSNAYGLRPYDDIEIHVLSASKRQLSEGIAGVAVRSYFYHEYEYNPLGADCASITGPHGPADYGFARQVEKVYEGLASVAKDTTPGVAGYATTPYPLLHRPASPYKTGYTGIPRLANPEEFAALEEQVVRCQNVSARLLHLDDEPGRWAAPSPTYAN